MEFVILTGLSGAGKTNALHAMEDIGFYCVDNLPPLLLDTFYDLCEKSTDNRMKRVAVVADARSGEMFAEIADVLQKAKLDGRRFKILFLDAKLDVLVVRYKETRRKHPLIGEMVSGSVEEAVELENELMKEVREMADYVIDTTFMQPAQLKERVTTLFTGDARDSLLVTFMSFGFKYGIPMEADLVLDVRFLPNPYYQEELKNLSGLDQPVFDYVMNHPDTAEYMEKLTAFLDFQLPRFREEGKPSLTVAVGCTGGRHRSISVARALTEHLLERGQNARLICRDMGRITDNG